MQIPMISLVSGSHGVRAVVTAAMLYTWLSGSSKHKHQIDDLIFLLFSGLIKSAQSLTAPVGAVLSTHYDITTLVL